jgi:hypothetical protein
VTFKDPQLSDQEVPSGDAVLGSSVVVPTSPKTAEDWAEVIRCDLATETAAYISAGRKFIQAKAAFKKTKTNESFTHLVTDLLGHDLGTVERWMKIARHPVLSESANLPILPTAWTTLYTLSQIPPKLLRKYIADGVIHPRLSGKAATALLRRGANGGRNSDGGGDTGLHHDEHRDGDVGYDHDGRRDGDDHAHGRGGDHGGDDGDHGGDRGRDHGGDHQRADTGNTPATDIVIGPDSPGEIARKLARLEELERETRRQAIQLAGSESENEELKAKLGPETPIRAQQRLFQQALRSLQKAEVSGTLEKDRRFLRESATTDFVELVRSAIRDGLKPERLDLIYRPELH